MDLKFLQYKVLQTLHDPIHKIAIQSRMGHVGAGHRLCEAITNHKQTRPFRACDWLATGADRPVVGNSSSCFVHWPTTPTVTHPLQPATCLEVEWDVLAAPEGSRKAAATDLHDRIHNALLPLALPPGAWETSDVAVRRLLLGLWRLTPGIVRGLGLQAPYLPADSRCPDHSVWEHTRVASAAAFLVEKDRKNRPAEREPWMLALTLGGVQRFLEESRKTRDLWTASMIYADLAWAAMRPLVEELGPDAVLYPDLRANPSADRWLLATAEQAVPGAVRATGATTFAAMLPNTFVALVPRGGGSSGLPDLKELARSCKAAVRERWSELAGAVETWLRRRVGRGSWQEIWKRQVGGRLGEPPVSWVAVPWPRRMVDAGEPVRRPALPGQAVATPAVAWPEALVDREAELAPWLPDRIWAHYELARDVYWHTHEGYLTNERGFDYPLVHHQLRAALAMRKAAGRRRQLEEPGEKCSLTGREEVLYNGEAGSGPPVTRRRQGARQFWQGFDADGLGAERLGSTATIKRYLVRAAEPGLTATWESPAERAERGGAEPRVPFPSMAALAAGSFLEDLAEHVSGGAVASAIGDYVAAFGRSELKETVDPRCLTPLARAARTPGMAKLLRIEPEYLFPETLEILVRRAGNDAPRRARLDVFRGASASLRDAARAEIPRPRKLVAVLKMDGDALGRLILGDPQVVATRWQDVLHPEAVKQVEKKLGDTGWPGLLGERRHMGPAVHAAVSRSLADFAHKMVAWVVERELNGRLIYAGGDDLLALLPAAEAVLAAARLQQLFSAPYVLDTDAGADPWAWRRGGAPGTTTAARQRFRVPVAANGEIRLSAARYEQHAAGDATASDLPTGRETALYPMLGRGHSLSAGIAVAHYKTPLGLMLKTASELLDDTAKEIMARGALAVTLLSRSGTKATFTGKWRMGAEPAAGVDPEPPDVQEDLERVRAAFEERQADAGGSSGHVRLPGRVPYKLRDAIETTGRVLLEQRADRGDLVRNLVIRESGLAGRRPQDEAMIESVARLLEAGLGYAARLDAAERLAPGELPQLAVAGLLVARRLATDGGDDGPA